MKANYVKLYQGICVIWEMMCKWGWKAGSLEGREIMDNIRGHLVTAKEAATYLGISLSTLSRIEKEARLLPFRTPGGHRRYDLAMLDEYLESTRTQPSEKIEVIVRHI